MNIKADKMIRFILLMFIVICVSCQEDEIKNVYNPINKIIIDDKGFTDTIYMSCSAVDTLVICPQISATVDNTSDRYEYEWIVSTNAYVGSQILNTIATTKNLRYPVSLMSAEYTLSYRVLDKITNIKYTKQTTLSVRDRLTEGWLVLGENEKKEVQVDMISLTTDTCILKDVCSNRGLPILKNPTIIYAVNRRNNHGIYLGAEESYVLRRKNHETANSEMPIDNVHFLNQGYAGILRKQFHLQLSEPAILRDIIQVGGMYRVVNVNGDAYFMSLYDLYLKFSSQINHYKDSYQLFEIGDKIAFSPKASASLCVLYNINEQRFVCVDSYIQNYCDPLNDTQTDKDIFSWKTGLEYVTTLNSYFSNGLSYTILKDTIANDYFIYAYSIGRTCIKYGKYKIENALDFNETSKIFGFSTNYPYMFYSTDAKVYGYDYIKQTSKEILDFGIDELTMAYYDIRLEPREDVFYIATYNETELGRIRKYKVIDNSNTIEVQQLVNTDWKGLCRVKSIDYKFNVNRIADIAD